MRIIQNKLIGPCSAHEVVKVLIIVKVLVVDAAGPGKVVVGRGCVRR